MKPNGLCSESLGEMISEKFSAFMAQVLVTGAVTRYSRLLLNHGDISIQFGSSGGVKSILGLVESHNFPAGQHLPEFCHVSLFEFELFPVDL